MDDQESPTKSSTSLETPNIAEVDHGEKLRHLSPLWLKQGVKTAFSAETYIQNSMSRLESMLSKTFPTYKTPMSEVTHPELDESPLLNAADHAKFRSIVGCANWLITLGRFDIAYATNQYSRFAHAPRQGHLLRIFAYTCNHEV